MNNPTRYRSFDENMVEDASGDYVAFSDYQIVLQQLQDQCNATLALLNQRKASHEGDR
jgi:hypothetical protein